MSGDAVVPSWRRGREQAGLVSDFSASRVGRVEAWARAARNAYAGLAGGR